MGVKKAVFPVAGLGTRILPATKASPKEMLQLIDKPLVCGKWLKRRRLRARLGEPGS